MRTARTKRTARPQSALSRDACGDAVAPYCEKTFITPMAAVAGAVAEEILGTMTSAASFHGPTSTTAEISPCIWPPGEQFVAGMVERPDRPSLFGTAMLDSAQPVRGIATSGWRGRSFSLGIADAVTVLADSAAMADAAATIIANAVDLPGHRALSAFRRAISLPIAISAIGW